MARSKRPPRVFLSYAHEGRDHQNSVLALANRLRQEGIDVALDQYENNPPGGWASWTERMIRESDFVLSVCTPVYLRRFLHQNAANVGRGVRWEGRLINSHIYAAGSETDKFIPVLKAGGTLEDVPLPLQAATAYHLDSETDYTDLLRRLKGKRRVFAPLRARTRIHDFLFWNVPLQRNRWFTGRKEVFTALRHALAAGYWIQGISGLGGIGKTQTAVEYAYRFRTRYDAVYWVSAATEEDLLASFSEIARLMEPGDAGEEPEDPRRIVQRALEQSVNWLFIFDNADEPGLLPKYLPQHANGHVLITSRAQALHHAGISRPIELDRLSEPDAVAFLFERTGRKVTGEEKDAVAELAHELGFLPLALEQAAAFVVEKQSRFRDYLATYKRRAVALLEQQKPVTGGYPSSVAGTWSLNFQQVESDPAAADLLRLTAFLSPDAIPLELVVSGAPVLGPDLSLALGCDSEDRLALDKVLSSLTRYSLVRRNVEEDTFSVHRLVQEIVRSTLDDAARELWVERTILAVSRAMPAAFPAENWPAAERLMPHVFACEQLPQPKDRPLWQAGELFHQAGWYLQVIVLHDQAERLYRRAISVWESAGEKGELACAATLHNLGVLCWEANRYSEAESFLFRAQASWERRSGDSLRLVQMLSALATVHLDCNRPEKAKRLLDRILGVLGVLPPNEPLLAGVDYQFARFHRLQGQTAEAESFCERAIHLDPNNFDARSMLAEIDKENGKSPDERQLPVDDAMAEALAHRIAALSPTQIDVTVRRLELIRRKNIASRTSRGGSIPAGEVSKAQS